MKNNYLVEVLIYSQLTNEWKWVLTLMIVGTGLFLIWVLYKAVLFKLTWGSRKIECNKKESKDHFIIDEEIVMPFTGRLLPIDKVPDPIFATKMVGDGFAIEPMEGEIYSPINGKIMQIYSNSDAITFRTNGGRNVILHIGVDTRGLKGQGITYFINEGEEVHAGQKIGQIDLEFVIPRVSSIISPVVFPDLKDSEEILLYLIGQVEAGARKIAVIRAYRT